MGSLLLVRHGQASILADDYDRLSVLGEQQSRLLGEHWARRGVTIDAVFQGPRERQRRTALLAGEAFAAGGGAFPAPIELAALDEMQGDAVLKSALPELVQQHDDVRRLAEGYRLATERRLGAGVTTPGHRLGEEAVRALDRLFEWVMVRWVRGEIAVGHLEPWSRFRERVREVTAAMLGATTGKGQTVAAFTSAGPVAAVTAMALGLDDDRTLALMLQVKNASVTELYFSGSRLSLHAFNGTPHLGERALETMR